MTLFRRISPAVDAVQFQDTPLDAEQLAFSETPDWLQTALDTGAVTRHAGDIDDTVNATVNAKYGPLLAVAGDWIIYDDGTLNVLPDDYFGASYEPIGDAPATPPVEPPTEEPPTPTAVGAAASAAATTPGAA